MEVILLSGFILLIIILSLRIRIQIKLELLENKDKRVLKTAIISPIKNSSQEYNLENLELKISSFFTAEEEEKNANYSKNEPLSLFREDSGFNFFLDFFKEADSKMQYYKISRMYLKYLLIENLDWRSSIGMNDAMKTAIASGSLWAFKGIIVSQLSNKSRIEKIFLNVSPDFVSSFFLSRLNCILKMRIAHIILIGFYYYGYLFKRYLKSLAQ
jgi:hypothetical protein